MLTFLSVAFLIYGSMHLYALRKVWAAFPHSSALGLLLVLAGVVLTFSPLLVWFLERKHWHTASVAAAWASYTWMGYVFLFVCIGLVVDLGHGLATLIGSGQVADSTKLQGVGLLALAMLGYGWIEARQLRIEDVTITTPKLASGQVTLAQLSDLHLGAMRGERFLAEVVARLREIKPDLVVATGDIVDGEGDDLAALARHLRSYRPPLGAYAVTGNHETYAGLDNSLRFLHEAGFVVLRGDWARAGGIVLAGVDDPSAAPPGQQARLDGGRAAASVSADDFIVLLKHQPVVDAGTPFDLQLSGHVHGGQIFPFVYLTWLSYRVRAGLTRLGEGRWLYVSRGAGTWGPPIRVFAPPEIARITIESANR